MMKGKKEEPPIAVKDLSKAFGSQKVLTEISLQVEAGKTLAVLGRSGTGKSVLLKLLIGLLAPDQGSVRIQGREIAQLGPKQLNEVRKKMRFLFQQSPLYDALTLAENDAFPLH